MNLDFFCWQCVEKIKTLRDKLCRVPSFFPLVFVFVKINHAAQTPHVLSENKLHALSYIFSNDNIFLLYICKRWLAAFAVWWWCGVCLSASVENLGPLKQVQSSRAKSNRFHKLMAKKVRNVSVGVNVSSQSWNLIELCDRPCCADNWDDAVCIQTLSKSWIFLRLLLLKNE